MDDKLKPCPFCGRNVKFWWGDDGEISFIRGGCGNVRRGVALHEAVPEVVQMKVIGWKCKKRIDFLTLKLAAQHKMLYLSKLARKRMR